LATSRTPISALFAQYARAFAQRFRGCSLYTPVNEMLICALGALRLVNEQLRSDRLRDGVKHLCESQRAGEAAHEKQRHRQLWLR
jgi:hypothetical protein